MRFILASAYALRRMRKSGEYMDNQFNVIQEYYDDIAVEYADEWYSNGSFNDILKAFVNLLDTSPKILDMGCGAGYHSITLNSFGADVTGIDFSKTAIQIAREKGSPCDFRVMNFLHMNTGMGRFDGIVSIATLMHIADSDLPVVFKQVKNVLKCEGHLMLVVNIGKGVGQAEFISKSNDKHYSFINYFHSLCRINELAENEGLSYVDEWALPIEHAERGWRCYLYKCGHITEKQAPPHTSD